MNCPSCKGCGVVDWGPLRSRKGALVLADPGHLYHCGRCGLWFRRPYLSEEELAAAYASVPAGAWPSSGERFDEKFARERLSRTIKGGAVLDCGCFRGDFLSALPESLEKYGIEPSQDARNVAATRGINLVSSNISGLPAGSGPFDGITMFDVIEHLPEPLEALDILVRSLARGGSIIVSTGDTDAPMWRLMRRDHWYYCPEHVSFFNRGWFRWAAHRLGLEVTGTAQFSHWKGSVSSRWRQCARAVAFRVAQEAERWKGMHRLLLLQHAFRWPEPPFTGLWPDHMVVVMADRSRGLSKKRAV